jgi:hypothetical protein
MSTIEKWKTAKLEHEQLVKNIRNWLRDPYDTGPYFASTGSSQYALWCAMTVLKASRQHLFECMLEVSRERVVNAAREALADAEQLKADATMDIESIENSDQN